jgi:hypothetical protein
MRWALLAGAVVLGSTVASIRLFDASAQQFSPGGTGEAFPQDDPAIAPTPVGPHVMRGWMHGGLAGAARPGAEMLSLVYEADQNAVVATFAMNRHTGALLRLG